MAQTVDISTLPAGVSFIVINSIVPESDRVVVQVVSSAALDSTIDLSLAQSVDGTEWHDLPEPPLNADIGENSNHLETLSFFSTEISVKIDKLAATVGILTIFNPKTI